MSEPAQKCEKQNYTQKVFISFKISYSCCFGFRGNLEFPDFLQKKFYNINYRIRSLPSVICVMIYHTQLNLKYYIVSKYGIISVPT